MFSSKLSVVAALLFTLSQRVTADVGVIPALGVAGTFTEDDVQPFLAGADCGTIDVASNIDNSTAVPAAADGSFNVTGSSFALGADGSTTVTATVDTTGKGNAFDAALQITLNGVANQTSKPNLDPLSAVLPDNTTCTGGAAGNLCLVAFRTGGGFSNCVVVSQGASSNLNSTSAANSTDSSNSTTTSSASNSTSTSTQDQKKKKAKAAAAKAKAKAAQSAKNGNANSNSTISATGSSNSTTSATTDKKAAKASAKAVAKAAKAAKASAAAAASSASAAAAASATAAASGTDSANSTSTVNTTARALVERTFNSRIVRIAQDRQA